MLDFEREIYAELRRRLLPAALAHFLFVAVVLTSTPLASRFPLLLGLLIGSIFMSNVARIVLSRSADELSREKLRHWRLAFRVTLVGTAFGWGLVEALAIRSYGIENHATVLVTLGIAGMTAGASSSLSADRLWAYAYTLLIMGLPMLSLFLSGPPHVGAFAATMLAFMLFCLSQVKQNNASFTALLTAHRSQEREEAALRKSEKTYRDLVEASHEIIWSTNAEGILTFINAAAKNILGYSPQEMMGRPFADFVDPTILERERGTFERVSREKTRVYNYETQALHRDGSSITMNLNMVPLVDEKGRLYGITGTSWDVTLHRKAEEDLRRMQMQMQQAQKMESLGKLAGGIAHDFNNVLAVIQGFSETLHERLKDEPALQAKLDPVLKAAERGSDLTRQLLGFARTGTLRLNPLHLGPAIHEALGLLSHSIDKSISIEELFEENLWPVSADVTQLMQVMMNVGLNARDAMPGGGRLSVTARNVDARQLPLPPRPLRAGRYVVLSISDTGEGIEDEVQSRIFDPFFTTKDIGRGTGLGLSVVYSIMQNHGGAITLKSRPGVGSTFELWFPALAENVIVPEKPFAKSETPAPDLQGQVFLVVDDEEDIREHYGELLTPLGARLLFASSGAEAVDVFRRHVSEISAVILDVNMPGLRGTTAYELMTGIRPEVRVLFVSGYSEALAFTHAYDRKFVDFLEKPFSGQEFCQRVKRMVA